MPKAIFTIGISASGKTTLANELRRNQRFLNINRDSIRFNMVCPGTDWRTYKFNKANEDRVSELQMALINEAIRTGQDVIVSDTNLNPLIRSRLAKVFKDAGYKVENRECEVTLEEAWRRDTHRENGVGHSRIYQQHQQWLRYTGRKTYEPNTDLPRAIIFDVDGTLADHQGIRSPFEWSKVGQDRARTAVVDMLHGYRARGYNITILSGRDGVCREETLTWLHEQGIHDFQLHMRSPNDRRKDTVIKEELFWKYLANQFYVVGVVDDRPSVVRLWHELGIENVICVGNPWIEF